MSKQENVDRMIQKRVLARLVAEEAREVAGGRGYGTGKAWSTFIDPNNEGAGQVMDFYLDDPQ